MEYKALDGNLRIWLNGNRLRYTKRYLYEVNRKNTSNMLDERRLTNRAAPPLTAGRSNKIVGVLCLI